MPCHKCIDNQIHTFAGTALRLECKKIMQERSNILNTGEFRFPKDEASKLAIFAVKDFLRNNPKAFDKIVFNVYGEEDYKIYERNIT